MELQSKLITLLVIICLTSCSKTQVSTENANVIVDVTMEDKGGIPETDKILSDLQNFIRWQQESKINNGYDFSISLFDDISGSSPQHRKIAAETTGAAMGNPIKRKNEFKKFEQEIATLIGDILKSTAIDRKQSKIYSKLCNVLSNKSADNTTLVIYSDLLENSELASFYDPATLAKATKDPVGFYEKNLAKECKLSDLNNTTIYLMTYHTPGNDVPVKNAEKFWSELLRKKGAIVKINP